MRRPGAVHAASRLEALRAAPELAGWPAGRLKSLLPYVDEVGLPEAGRLAVEGRPCTEFAVVVAGRLRAQRADGAGRALGAGDSVGWEAMWEGGANEATVVAESDARLLVVGRAQFRALKGAGRRAQEPAGDRRWGSRPSRVLALLRPGRAR